MSQQIPTEELDLNEILRVRREKLKQLVEEGNNPYEQVKYLRTHTAAEILADYNELQGREVSIAGRIISRRLMGKASFCHILDGSGTIQIYVRSDEECIDYEAFKSYDIGDIVGVRGTVFQTRTGEISIHATALILLSKSLLPLPEKFHGLKDNDMRFRQRYVDLIANPEVRKVFAARSRIITAIRSCLDERGYLEVETPILSTLAGGATARPFVTHHNTLDIDMFLRIAPELYLKRLIVGGFEKVYELGRMFRNEGMDMKHNPEFTMIETYEAYADYNDMMLLVEDIISRIVETVRGGDYEIEYQGRKINLKPPYRRITMVEAVKEYTGIDFETTAIPEIVATLKAKGVETADEKTSWGNLLFLAFDELVESNLVQPTFILDHPIEISPLAKKKKSDPRLTERFEFFLCTWELGNAYSELNDPIDQKERFVNQMKLRAAGDDEAQIMDEDFVNALEYGMPPTGGLGIGIDRLVMLFTNAPTIREVLLFPTMKPKA